MNRYMIALLLQFIVAENKLDLLQASEFQYAALSLRVVCLFGITTVAGAVFLVLTYTFSQIQTFTCKCPAECAV